MKKCIAEDNENKSYKTVTGKKKLGHLNIKITFYNNILFQNKIKQILILKSY